MNRITLGLTIFCLAFVALLAPPRAGQAEGLRSATTSDTPGEPPGFATLCGTAGFWRIGRDEAGVWWFLNPHGQPDFLNGVTTVVPHQESRDLNGSTFTSTDWDASLPVNDRREKWLQATARRVRQTGFKSLGAWCDPGFHSIDIPVTRDLNLTTWTPNWSRRVHDREWAAEIESAAARQIAGLRDNRNLVGYYLDNELDWELCRTSDPDALGRVAEEYFRVTTSVVRKLDPNHLILGVRFRGYAPAEVVRASRQYTDAQSLNYYPGDARLDREMFTTLSELSGQPVIISEYGFHAPDNRSGDTNRFGFVAGVKDQAARAEGYRQLTSRLARVPYVIGADWFQWSDEPPAGRLRDGEDVNFGVVDTQDQPYEPLANAIRATTPTLNNLHDASASDDRADVWRAKGPAQQALAEVSK